MFVSQPLIRALVTAIGLSVAALAAAVILQGTFLFPRQLQALLEGPQVVIRRLMPLENGGCVVLTNVRTSRLVGGFLEHSLCVHHGDPGKPDICQLACNFTLWNAAASRSGDRLFLSSPQGNIYSLDLCSSDCTPQILGTHPGGYVDLESAHDGSFAFTTNRSDAICWRPGRPTALWERTDIVVTSACFHPTSPRLFCGLDSGQCVELDPSTGATLHEFRVHWDLPIALDISADGKHLVALGNNGTCVVTDFERNQPLWEMQLLLPLVSPRFSPDGSLVLTASPQREPCVNVVSAATGELTTKLTGAKAEIAGLAVATSGLVYAWDSTGTITTWNLSSGALLHQFQLARLSDGWPSS
jgi:WD40 repeat protein